MKRRLTSPLRRVVLLLYALAIAGTGVVVVLTGFTGLAWERGSWRSTGRTTIHLRPSLFTYDYDGRSSTGSSRHFDFVGFRWHEFTSTSGRRMIDLALPTGPLFAAFAIPYLLNAIYKAQRRRTRARRGKCLACAYNLTGNTSGSCPECGTAIQSQDQPETESALRSRDRHD